MNTARWVPVQGKKGLYERVNEPLVSEENVKEACERVRVLGSLYQPRFSEVNGTGKGTEGA
ncbi:MAG: hypothetical protein HPY55_05700 [Firmicutes bacterium]|nr:hypothetical protein [Bacillota bacterium]